MVAKRERRGSTDALELVSGELTERAHRQAPMPMPRPGSSSLPPSLSRVLTGPSPHVPLARGASSGPRIAPKKVGWAEPGPWPKASCRPRGRRFSAGVAESSLWPPCFDETSSNLVETSHVLLELWCDDERTRDPDAASLATLLCLHVFDEWAQIGPARIESPGGCLRVYDHQTIVGRARQKVWNGVGQTASQTEYAVFSRRCFRR
jgi:hypothetical protein